MSENSALKQRATKISSATAIFLAIAKIAVFFITGSLAVLGSALDSILDTIVSIGNFLAVKKSDSKPTKQFRYGFGKLEGLVGLFQGILIGGSGLFLGILGVQKILTPQSLHQIDIAIGVMIFSTIATFLLVKYLRTVAKQTKSLVIESDSEHYKSDVYANGGILLGVGLVWITGWDWLDGVIAVVVGGVVLFSGGKVLLKSVFALLDHEADTETRKKIEQILIGFEEQQKISGYHFLRTRQSGSKVFVDVHVVFSPDILLIKAHHIADDIEKKILAGVGEGEVLIHLDPVDDSHEERERYGL